MDFKNTHKTYSFFMDYGIKVSVILKLPQKIGLNSQSGKILLKNKNKLLKQLNNVLKGKFLRNRIKSSKIFIKKLNLISQRNDSKILVLW